MFIVTFIVHDAREIYVSTYDCIKEVSDFVEHCIKTYLVDNKCEYSYSIHFVPEV